MKKPSPWMAALAALIVAGSAVAQTGGDADAFDNNDAAGVDADTRARCWLLGQAFYKLAYVRDGGSDKQVAIYNVSHWLKQRGNTGSHVGGFDFTKATTVAADLVYAHKDLYPATLSAYGGRSCKIQRIFQAEPERQQAGAMLLMDAAETCQAKHPGQHHNGALRQCMKDAETSVVARVRKAQIKVQ